MPADIDKEIARLKLAGMGVAIDTLTVELKQHLASWEMGTLRAGAARVLSVLAHRACKTNLISK